MYWKVWKQMFEAMLKLVCRSYVQILAALYFLSFFWEGAQTIRKSMKHAHLDGIQRTKTLVQDKYGWYKPTAQRQQKTVLSKDIEAQNAKTIEKNKKQKKKTIFQRSWNRGPPQRVCKYCFFCFFCFFLFFFCFFNVFLVFL